MWADNSTADARRMRISRLRPEHHEAVYRLLEVGLSEQEQFAALCSPPEDRGFLETELREHHDGLQKEPECWHVAIAPDDEVVGLVWLRFLEDELGRYGTVRQVIVSPDYRRRGVGTRLLREAESLSREADAVMVLVSALRPNPAWHLYRALGFSDFPARFRKDANPEHVVLWKWLGPHDPRRPPGT